MLSEVAFLLVTVAIATTRLFTLLRCRIKFGSIKKCVILFNQKM